MAANTDANVAYVANDGAPPAPLDPNDTSVLLIT